MKEFSVVVNFKKQFCQFCFCQEYFVVGLFFTVKWHFFFFLLVGGCLVLYCFLGKIKGESQLLLSRDSFPVIQDVMQILVLGKLNFLPEGVPSCHVNLLPVVLLVRPESLPDLMGAL